MSIIAKKLIILYYFNMKKVDLPKTYDAKKVEDGIYRQWEESGFFNPDNLPGDRKESFAISMPPPNATGILHTGHVTMLAIEDLMIRYNRMKGKKTLWLPGTDHAAIATQTKVEKLLAKEKLSRQKLGREKFLRRVDQFVADSRDIIRKQTKRMGSSCDWSRERFTLDEGLTRAVKEAFVRMYDDGLIYRGHRIVNWCPRCQSTLADDEVKYKNQKAKLYYFKYGLFEVATTRPETKIGDTALAVNPKDKRYKKYIGQKLDVDFGKVKVQVKVIGDEAVDPEFGTGVVGVTPAHSQVDYQMAEKNKLLVIQVIGQDGKMTENAGPYAGMSVEKCREAFLNDLKSAGLFIKEEEIDNNLSVCYRCDTPVEPLTSDQWFVAVDKPFKLKDKSKLGWKKDTATLKELAIHVVKSGKIKIIPERFEKVYFHWLENLHDWCISRQIWYGHRIPVWQRSQKHKNTKTQKQEIYVGVNNPDGEGWIQDEDTLDTWFSSGLWTFSTLGWPASAKASAGEANDLKLYHPTSVMETGYDILFFWVARMIIMTAYCLNNIPFKVVYLHGMVRTDEGAKMSKSLDNALDPLKVIEKYGTDALRLSMILGVTPGNDFKLYDEKIAGYRNFVNKLWNISRFVIQEVGDLKLIKGKPAVKTLADEWILNRLDKTASEVSKNLDEFQFSLAGETLEQFTWNDFADWYLEIAKIEKNKDEILLYVLQNILKMWHPFCPFVTEEIWSHFNSDKLLMIEEWPKTVIARSKATKQSHVADFEFIQSIITAIRNLRGENKVEPAKLVKATVVSKNKKDLIESQTEIIKKLARLEELNVETGHAPSPQDANIISAIITGAEIYLDLSGIIDVEAEKKRVAKEIAETENYIKTIEAKLANKEFVENAPKAIVDKEKEKLAGQKEKLEKLKNNL